MGTIRYNLDLEHQYDNDEIYEALESCQIKSFVDSLPDDLDTEISDGGTTFSQGQRQLICLAGVFLSRSRIVVFDEATVAVDPETDSLIQESVREISRGKTGELLGNPF